tara:strand:+ start:1915 stop:2610 length:696 start_codon:yes stop_codon:yes gene_type:complete
MKNGLINIWLNAKNLSNHPLRHLKCKTGYCLLAKSKTYKNINIDNCIEHSSKVGDIILCKLQNWESYVPAKILKKHDKSFDLYFKSCPDSDIFLTWHSGNKILRERSMLTYVDPIKCSAPFVEVDYINSGLFDKKDTYENELLIYKLYWLNATGISNENINISHNIAGTLSNVRVLRDIHFKNIVKMQWLKHCLQSVDCSQSGNLQIFNKFSERYTGKLCTEAKNYLYKLM